MLTRQQYIERIAPMVKKACEGADLFPSVMIAQAIVESGNGNSKLSSLYHNHFGIKADAGWKGLKILLPTREVIKGKSVMVNAYFRKYNTDLEGFCDRNQFLKTNPRYMRAGVFTAETPEDQAKAFQKAGYATDPNYANLIISVVNGSGRLKQYD